MRIFRVGLIFSVFLLSVGCSHIWEARYARKMVGKLATDFELQSLGGGKIKLSDFQGKPVLLSFWAHG